MIAMKGCQACLSGRPLVGGEETVIGYWLSFSAEAMIDWDPPEALACARRHPAGGHVL